MKVKYIGALALPVTQEHGGGVGNFSKMKAQLKPFGPFLCLLCLYAPFFHSPFYFIWGDSFFTGLIKFTQCLGHFHFCRQKQSMVTFWRVTTAETEEHQRLASNGFLEITGLRSQNMFAYRLRAHLHKS